MTAGEVIQSATFILMRNATQEKSCVRVLQRNQEDAAYNQAVSNLKRADGLSNSQH
jgi:hypothetical protein